MSGIFLSQSVGLLLELQTLHLLDLLLLADELVLERTELPIEAAIELHVVLPLVELPAELSRPEPEETLHRLTQDQVQPLPVSYLPQRFGRLYAV